LPKEAEERKKTRSLGRERARERESCERAAESGKSCGRESCGERAAGEFAIVL
jgi:hypothetical protein